MTAQLVRVGITGHINLTRASADLVYDALLAALSTYPAGALRGVTCLAEGADQIFARAVVATGGSYEAILPSRDYRRCLRPGNVRHFDSLLDHAVTVTYASRQECGEAAYAAANEELLRRCDQLLAVWDGRPGSIAGTAEVVERAGRVGVPVTRIWPEGSRRWGRFRGNPLGEADPSMTR